MTEFRLKIFFIFSFFVLFSVQQRARLEDVVVNNTYRGNQLGKL